MYIKNKIDITIYRDALNNIVLQEVEEQITREQWKSDLKHANCFRLSPASPSLGQARHCIFNRLYALVQEIISGVITSRNTTS